MRQVYPRFGMIDYFCSSLEYLGNNIAQVRHQGMEQSRSDFLMLTWMENEIFTSPSILAQ